MPDSAPSMAPVVSWANSLNSEEMRLLAKHCETAD
jgi:hypothetical protein